MGILLLSYYNNVYIPDWLRLTGSISDKPSLMKNLASRYDKVIQYTKGGDYICTFKTIGQAAKETGIKKSNISAALNKHVKSAGGYIWKGKKRGEI